MSISPLVIGDILDRLDRLELSRPSANEALIPNSYTIDPAGNVVVVGVDLPAGTSSTPPTQSRIRWLRQSDGAVAADVTAYSTSGIESLVETAYALAPADQAVIGLQVLDSSGINQGSITINSNDYSAGAGPPDTIRIGAGTQQRMLLMSTGRSHYLQIGPATGAMCSIAGTDTLTWAGGTLFSNTLNITLPFASGNVAGVASCDGIAGTTDAVVVDVHNVGNGTANLRGGVRGGGLPVAGSTANVYYILWGN